MTYRCICGVFNCGNHRLDRETCPHERVVISTGSARISCHGCGKSWTDKEWEKERIREMP